MDTPDDVAMPFLLMASFRNLVDAVHAKLEESGFPGVRTTHGFAMQAIGTGCTSAELGNRLGVSKQAATQTAGALAEMGFLDRRQNPDDRREWRLVPTRRGRRMLQVSATAFRSEVRTWRASVGDAQVDATLATLAAVGAGGRAITDLSDWG